MTSFACKSGLFNLHYVGNCIVAISSTSLTECKKNWLIIPKEIKEMKDNHQIISEILDSNFIDCTEEKELKPVIPSMYGSPYYLKEVSTNYEYNNSK